MNKGFTLIEVIVVIVILLVLVTMGVGAASNFSKETVVKTAARTLATTLTEARARTLASENASQFGIHVVSGESQVTLFQGTTYSSSDPDNVLFEFDSRVTIVSSNTDVVFTRLSGATTAITIDLVHAKDSSVTRSVSVQSTGVVFINE